jgi:pSer/pThr/pTyr-binding forkhead associated (FHA) protein
MTVFRDLLKQLSGLSADELALKFPAPFLVFLDWPEEGDEEDTDLKAIATGSYQSPKVNADPGGYPAPGAQVFRVAKDAASTNPFATMITLGRARNNDIVVPAEGVSNFHAYFSQGADGWTVSDAKSRNGTFHGDLPVATATPLGDDELLRVAWFRCRFLTPEGMHALITRG